ncbi:uncharacterized protein [Oscarella lobularis]|uniref:uncharacterized protein isoform X2 n=1 Tax=Oscarella lobularis TaxID=121494 RepID=UPI003313B000
MTSDFDFVFKLAELSENDCNDIVRSSLRGTIRLGETVSDFVKKLGQTYDKFSNDLKHLVRGFKKTRSSDDSKKERFSWKGHLYRFWEVLLAEVGEEANDFSRLASKFDQTIVQPLADACTSKKHLYKKVIYYREQMEDNIRKSCETVAKTQKERDDEWAKKSSKQDSLSKRYHRTHNDYLLALWGSNALISNHYQSELPDFLRDIMDIRLDMAQFVKAKCDGMLSLTRNTWSAIFERLGPVSETCKKLNLASEGNAFMESAPVRQLQPMLTLPLNVYQQPKSAGSDYFYGEELADDPSLDRNVHIASQQSMTLTATLKEKETELESAMDVQRCYAKQHSQLQPSGPLEEQVMEIKQQIRLARSQFVVNGEKLKKLRKAQFCSGRTSLVSSHTFEQHNYRKMTNCAHCGSLLKGLFHQGFRCKACKINVHDKCRSKVEGCKQVALTENDSYMPTVEGVETDTNSTVDKSNETDEFEYSYVDVTRKLGPMLIAREKSKLPSEQALGEGTFTFKKPLLERRNSDPFEDGDVLYDNAVPDENPKRGRRRSGTEGSLSLSVLARPKPPISPKPTVGVAAPPPRHGSDEDSDKEPESMSVKEKLLTLEKAMSSR